MILTKLAQAETKIKAFLRNKIMKRKIDRYMRSDRRPWSEGYTDFKEQYIQNLLSDKQIMDTFRKGGIVPANHGYRLDERSLEIPWVLSHLENEKGRLLDAGSSLNFEYMLTSKALQNLKTTIITLAPENISFPSLGISYVYGDLRNLEFKDNWFDVLTCISTIEHVGMDNSMYTGSNETDRAASSEENHPGYSMGLKQAILELRRVLKQAEHFTFHFHLGNMKIILSFNNLIPSLRICLSKPLDHRM
jgi:hypothetical protein